MIRREFVKIIGAAVAAVCTGVKAIWETLEIGVYSLSSAPVELPKGRTLFVHHAPRSVAGPVRVDRESTMCTSIDQAIKEAATNDSIVVLPGHVEDSAQYLQTLEFGNPNKAREFIGMGVRPTMANPLDTLSRADAQHVMDVARLGTMTQ